MEGAIKGAVTAGALNLASGIGHSMINAVGNSLSAISASISKSRLYDDAKKKLLSGIQDDIGRIINKHTDLLNEYERDYVVYYFKSEKADALFENAKEMADKREGLLVQAVRYAPWYHALLSYIFVNYERERKTAAELARRFGVDLSNDIEAALKSGYESSPKESDDDLLKLKNKLRSLMLEYNVSSSQTMDDLDKALLKRFLERAQQNTVAQCNELKAAVEAYDARAEIKSQYLKDIEKRRDDIWESGLQAICSGYEEADETHLQELLPKIGDFDAPEEIKKVYADRVRKQIDKIRSEEDDEVFSKIYLSTDLKDSKAVRQAIDLIIAKQRTDASEPYLKALKACITDTAEIEKAISYLRGRKGFKYWSLFFCVLIFAAAGFFLIAIHFVGNRINWPTYFISWGILEWPTSYICGVSFILMYVSTSFAAALKSADNDKRDALRKLTINGKHLHPALRYVPGRAELKRIAEHAAAKNNDDNPGFDGCVVACGWLAWLLFLCWIVGSFVYSLIFK
ncbi:hypothetical protein IJT93_10155 [bacterium]|nr:hypothetical protein [bacterium]